MFSEDGKLFKEKYEKRGYRYDERSVQAFCEDIIEDVSLNPGKKSSRRRSSRRGSSRRRSSYPCPENGEFPSENLKLSYIRFEEEASKYTEYTHKKYRKRSDGSNPADKGGAEDENGDAHDQDIFLYSFFVSHNNILVVFLDKELIEYETGKTYYLYLSELVTNNGNRESRRLKLRSGVAYTVYYWPPACNDDPSNSEKCECQNPDQPNCLLGKPEDPDWNRDALLSVQGLLLPSWIS